MTPASERDFREVEQLLYRYAWMVDRREWSLMDEVFAPGGTIDYASTGGPGAMPYREALAWLARALSSFPINLHHITNVSVDVSAEVAKARCYFTAPMARREPGGELLCITNAGYYFDDLVRADDRWRIGARFCDMTIQIGSLPLDHVIPPVD